MQSMKVYLVFGVLIGMGVPVLVMALWFNLKAYQKMQEQNYDKFFGLALVGMCITGLMIGAMGWWQQSLLVGKWAWVTFIAWSCVGLGGLCLLFSFPHLKTANTPKPS